MITTMIIGIGSAVAGYFVGVYRSKLVADALVAETAVTAEVSTVEKSVADLTKPAA